MENSIENVWKEGWLNNDALTSPKINDLYNRKSAHIIDKLNRMFVLNHRYIYVGAIVFVATGIFFGVPFIGLIIAAMLMLAVLISKRQMKAMEKVDKGATSYEYIKTFDNWLKKAMKEMINFNRFFYPTFFICFMLGMWRSDPGQLVIEKMQVEATNLSSIAGIPLILWVVMILVSIILLVFAKQLYLLDVKIVYGPVMKKLEELIQDMEELRK